MIVAGIGYRQQASVGDLLAALRLAQCQCGAPAQALASTHAKAETPTMRAVARLLKLPVIAVPEDQLAGVPTMTESARIRAGFNTGSLAEAAALQGAMTTHQGAQVRLLSPRVKTANGMATAAFAKGSIE